MSLSLASNLAEIVAALVIALEKRHTSATPSRAAGLLRTAGRDDALSLPLVKPSRPCLIDQQSFRLVLARRRWQRFRKTLGKQVFFRIQPSASASHCIP